MTVGELVIWSAVGIVFGGAAGAALARPDEAFDGLRDGLVQVGTMITRGFRGLVSWRPR